MTNTAYVVSVALLSAATAYAQIPGNREKWINESTAPLLTVSNGEPASAVGIDKTQNQYVDRQDPISSAGTYETSNLSADDDSVSALSQGGSVPSKDPGNLHIFVVPGYLWMSGLSGNVGVKNISLPINASFKDIFNNLNIGYMGGGDVRYRQIGLLTDVVYIKLTTKEQSTPFGVLYGTARTRAKTFFIEPDVYGRVIDKKIVSVDALAGVRVWRLDNGIDLSAGRLPALSLDSTNVWADPLLGARFRANLSRGLFGEFKGDAGIGPNETWEIIAGGGKEIKQKYNVLLAYRHLNAYQRDQGFLFDASMSGLLIGFGIRFK